MLPWPQMTPVVPVSPVMPMEHDDTDAMAHPFADRSSGSLAAVILAGGRAARLGGISKPLARIGDSTLLGLAIGAVPRCSVTVVVGPPEPAVPAGVLRVREDPPFSGPVAALVAGMTAIPPAAEWVLLLAADQPTVGGSVQILLAADRGKDGVIGIDGSGRRQPLAALYRSSALRAALQENGSAPRRMMDVTERMVLTEIWLGDRLDVDTPEDARHFGVQVPVTGVVTADDHDRPSR